jgi:hypothetical protein
LGNTLEHYFSAYARYGIDKFWKSSVDRIIAVFVVLTSLRDRYLISAKLDVNSSRNFCLLLPSSGSTVTETGFALGLSRDEVTEGSRKLHNEELHSLYSSPNVIRMIKSRRVRWAGHVARMGETKNAFGYWCESQKERDHW